MPNLTILLALAAGMSATAALVAAVIVLRRRFRVVRALTFVLCLAAVAAGLAVYKTTGVLLPPDFEQFFVWLLASLAAVTVLRLIGLYIFDLYFGVQRNIQLPPLLPSLSLAIAYLLASLLILRAMYPGLNLGPLLATSAVTSLVLGLALQPILGNFFAGLVISFERPYRLNDWIKVGDTEGRVVDITWRTTHLRTRDNDDLIIPNSRAADELVLNFYYPNPLHLVRVVVGAQYAAPPYRVRHALLESATGVTGVLERPSPDVYVLDFADSAITYELRLWINDIADRDRVRSDVRARIWESFARHGLTFPFPTRTLEIAPRPRRDDAPDARRPGRLYVVEGPAASTVIALPDAGGSLSIGRAEDNALQIADALVSKHHARIDGTADGYALVDLQSSGGTRVNGAAVLQHALRPLDRITIGNTTLMFEHDDR
jgi:small-conductance mechanosensitive channel